MKRTRNILLDDRVKFGKEDRAKWEGRILALREQGLTQDEIARRMGCSQTQVSKILRQHKIRMLYRMGEKKMS
jgi:DNA-directed RNA polymerase specialized sigma subunit